MHKNGLAGSFHAYGSVAAQLVGESYGVAEVGICGCHYVIVWFGCLYDECAGVSALLKSVSDGACVEQLLEFGDYNAVLFQLTLKQKLICVVK